MNKIMVALPLLLVGFGIARAEVYKCKQAGETVYSDKPCPGQIVAHRSADEMETGTLMHASSSDGSQSVASRQQEVSRNMDAPLAECGGQPGACLKHRLASNQDEERAHRAERCQSGDRQACDSLACVERHDELACARLEGTPTGNGWVEISRRRHAVPVNDRQQGIRMEREVEVTVQCTATKERSHIILRGSYAILRIEDAVTSGSRRLHQLKHRYPSLQEAAEAACQGAS